MTSIQAVRILIVAGLLGVGMWNSQAALANDTNDQCDTHWAQISGQHVRRTPPDYSGLLTAWNGMEKSCGVWPRYWARLALTYVYLHRPKDAKAALAAVKPADANKEPLVELVHILADAGELFARPTLDAAGLRALEERLLAYVDANPNEVVGLSLVADMLSQRGRHEVAIKAYEAVLKSIGVSRRSVGVMRNLTIAYMNAGRYDQAYELAGSAIELDKGLFTDMYFMCAVGKSQAATGEVANAEKTLAVLAAKRPEVKEHPYFQAAVAFVTDKARTTRK